MVLKKIDNNIFESPMGDNWNMKQIKIYYASKRIVADEPRPKDVKPEVEIELKVL